MATNRIILGMESAGPLGTGTMPELKAAGTNINILSYSFSATGTEGIQFLVPYVPNYTTGNLLIKELWYSDLETTGSVVWGASVACITPISDTQDMETDTWDAESTVTDTHLGTTAQRLHSASITLTGIDGIASGDYLALRIQRLGANAADTMTGDAQLVGVVVEFTGS